MTRKTFAVSALMLAIALLAASCSNGSVSTEATLEAQWQCDVQRHTFDDLAGLQAELERRIIQAGLTLEEYASFKEELSTSVDLRQKVAAEYDAYCAP